MRKADLEPAGGKSPDHVAIDETVIRLDNQRFWLYAAVDPATNEFLHVRLYDRCVMAFSQQFLAELLAKHDLDDAVFLVDGAPWLHGAPPPRLCVPPRNTRPAKYCRTYLQRGETPDRPVRKSLPHRLRRILAPDARILLEPATLNTAAQARTPNAASMT